MFSNRPIYSAKPPDALQANSTPPTVTLFRFLGLPSHTISVPDLLRTIHEEMLQQEHESQQVLHAGNIDSHGPQPTAARAQQDLALFLGSDARTLPQTQDL